MAKVLPAGYGVDLNLGQDPFDRFLKTIDMVMKVGSQFQSARDRRKASASNSMNDLMGMLTQGAQYLDAEGYQEIGSQISSATDTALQINDPVLNSQANLLKKVHKSMANSNREYEDGLVSFNNDFMNHDIFNLANYNLRDAEGNPILDAQGRQKYNQEFLDDINNRGIDWFNEMQASISDYQTLLFDVGRNGELIPKKANKQAQQAQKDFLRAKDMFYNLYDSQLEGKVSNAEFQYIASMGGLPNKKMDEYRDEVIRHTTARLNSLNRGISSTNKYLNTLQMKKRDKISASLRALKNDGNNIPMELFQEFLPDYELEDLEALGNFSPEEIELGSYLDVNGQLQAIPQKVEEMYNTLIQEGKNLRSAQNVEYDNAKDRFDFWSPFTWDSQYNSDVLGENTGTIQYKNVNQDRPVSDADKLKKAVVDKTVKNITQTLPVAGKKTDDKKTSMLKGEWDTYTPEEKEVYGNSFDNFVKSAEASATGTLDEKQLSIAKPEFKEFQRKTKSTVAILKRELATKQKRVGQMTSFNKESLKRAKSKMNTEISQLTKRITELEDLLSNTDIDLWLENIATKKQKDLILSGKTSAEHLQQYWADKNK